MIAINNLNFSYDNKIIFNDFNLCIDDKKITTIIGLNGSGKSTLARLLVGLLDYTGSIKIDNIEIKENIRDIRKKIGIVFEMPDNQIIKERVFDDIAYILKNMNFNNQEIDNKVLEVAKLLKIEDLLQFNIKDLNTSQKQLVCLASALVHNPKILILDEALAIIDPIERDYILKVIKKLKRSGLCIINISHNIEDTLISDKIIVLDNGQVLLNGKKEKIYESDKLLSSLGFNLPFIVELSNRLKFYGLIDHTIYDMKEMVDLLWK